MNRAARRDARFRSGGVPPAHDVGITRTDGVYAYVGDDRFAFPSVYVPGEGLVVRPYPIVRAHIRPHGTVRPVLDYFQGPADVLVGCKPDAPGRFTAQVGNGLPLPATEFAGAVLPRLNGVVTLPWFLAAVQMLAARRMSAWRLPPEAAAFTVDEYVLPVA